MSYNSFPDPYNSSGGALNPPQQGYPSQQGYPPQQGSGYPGAQAHYHGGGQPYASPQGPPTHSSSHAPAPAPGPSPMPPAAAGGAAAIATTGSIEGMTYNIAHRDSNSILSVRLPPGYELKAKPGAMVAMDPSAKIQGKLKFSFKKLVTGGELTESIFTGPGEILLAPEIWGDIVPIPIDGSATWFFGKDAFLAATRGVVRSTKGQSFGKALFSGEGLFVHQATGQGIVFVQSLGAIIQRQLAAGEQWIVDNGHLVAWTAQYSVERINGGGFLSSSHTDEGLVCRFKGPGKVYIQTRNPEPLISWIQAQLPAN